MSEFSEKQKRAIRKRDGYRCQFDRRFGISKLTKVKCSRLLEVHHKVYSKKARLCDGITICQRCHQLLTDMIRRERYSTRKVVPPSYNSKDFRNHGGLSEKTDD